MAQPSNNILDSGDRHESDHNIHAVVHTALAPLPLHIGVWCGRGCLECGQQCHTDRDLAEQESSDSTILPILLWRGQCPGTSFVQELCDR